MEATSPRILPQHQPGQTYCSQSRTAPPSFRTIEDGVRIIEAILKKKMSYADTMLKTSIKLSKQLISWRGRLSKYQEVYESKCSSKNH